MVQVPLFYTVKSEQELVASSFVENDACPVEDGTLTATLGGEVNERDIPINPPSWEEIAVLLRKLPCFTALEAPRARPRCSLSAHPSSFC